MGLNKNFNGAEKDSSEEAQIDAIILQVEQDIKRLEEEIAKAEAELAVNQKIKKVLDVLKSDKIDNPDGLRALIKEIDSEIEKLGMAQEVDFWPELEKEVESLLENYRL
ncbi:MAG: hypothetical protein AB1721_03235 [Patescibacteria group bacterium]